VRGSAAAEDVVRGSAAAEDVVRGSAAAEDVVRGSAAAEDVVRGSVIVVNVVRDNVAAVDVIHHFSILGHGKRHFNSFLRCSDTIASSVVDHDHHIDDCSTNTMIDNVEDKDNYDTNIDDIYAFYQVSCILSLLSVINRYIMTISMLL